MEGDGSLLQIATELEQEQEETPQERADYLSGVVLQQQRHIDILGMEYRKAKERLAAVEPVYGRWYRRLRWLMPWDAVLEGQKLMRCAVCGGLFLLNGEWEKTLHRGHRYSGAQGYSLWEHIRLRMGWIK